MKDTILDGLQIIIPNLPILKEHDQKPFFLPRISY